MFVGRLDEVLALEQALAQTRAGRPKHFMVTGERGIGKTSLLNYTRWLAQGAITLEATSFQFLVLDVDVERGTTPLSLGRKIERALRAELGKTEPARDFLAKTWHFLSRLEAAGVSIRPSEQVVDAEDFLDELAYSLAGTVERLCSDDSSLFGASYEGVLICVDEADRAPVDLQLGSLLKLLTERLQRRGCDRLVIGLAGLQDLRDVLREDHPSVLRIFDEIQLRRLTADEMGDVIAICLSAANEQNEQDTMIEDDAASLLITLSEGYPHFIQQFGYSAFAADADGQIDVKDVRKGAFAPRGALDLIGDRYYRDDFYNRIQQDSYRRVLRIMADKSTTGFPKTKYAVGSKARSPLSPMLYARSATGT